MYKLNDTLTGKEFSYNHEIPRILLKTENYPLEHCYGRNVTSVTQVDFSLL